MPPFCLQLHLSLARAIHASAWAEKWLERTPGRMSHGQQESEAEMKRVDATEVAERLDGGNSSNRRDGFEFSSIPRTAGSSFITTRPRFEAFAHRNSYGGRRPLVTVWWCGLRGRRLRMFKAARTFETS